MDLDYLTTFLEIAKQGSFSRAGQKLFRSQPAVSAQIRQLEEEYGQKLFDRVGKSMKLTAAGEVLLGYAGRLITLKNDSLRAVADQSAAPRGTLAVGANEATCLYVLPDVFAEFHRRFPAVRLTLRTAPTADLVAAVLDGTLDGAFVAGPIEHAELASTLAFREELVLVSARKWNSLAALRAGTPESGPTALGFRTGCTYRQRLEQVFSEFGWPSAARFELGTLDGMIGCVAADMGVTMLPRAVVERNDQHGNINVHTLNAAQSRVETLFIQRRSAHQYSALQGFAACLSQDGRVIAA